MNTPTFARGYFSLIFPIVYLLILYIPALYLVQQKVIRIDAGHFLGPLIVSALGLLPLSHLHHHPRKRAVIIDAVAIPTAWLVTILGFISRTADINYQNFLAGGWVNGLLFGSAIAIIISVIAGALGEF
ncbi:hypothetical protein [Citrobacter cronae]|uniref:Uncharacterized protein n=1 Tax=Citrobacter cronae TaxID=1748967 RepID=A0A7X1BS79_9ENTR|nr:hypothetical protein [Citrobacter cronae]EBD5843818.1 hypothetical protein [Salmonella enterica]EDD5452691.1 hypothetical protein [Salmonella enterica subsp. enterica serovar Paratyphi B]EBD6593454.1 hypothetical protein [Salmonella enterica]EDE4810625.1 hypothetical protein [Salmonella enterica subsp. enterica serovar Paratyphi B]MBC2622131.1 hypothetical protein [Citrobacter cronae]